LQIYRLTAIFIEANHEKNKETTLASNKADTIASLNAATINLDKYVLLSYMQRMLMIKNEQKLKISSSGSGVHTEEFLIESGNKPMGLIPILVRSTLSKDYSYAIVLTQNYNLHAECCDCSCHPKQVNFV
jgi:hypothetical protein